MSDPVSAVGAVAAASANANVSSLGPALPVREPMPATQDVARFQAMVTSPSASTGVADVGSKLVDAGVGLSQRYAERLDAAHQLTSISPEEYGVDHTEYMRAMLSVQVSLSEVTVELQSTAQIANSVKDSFNGLYRMQG